MNDWGIIGHHNAVTFLQRSIASGMRAHGFLFTGPAHVGKMTLARAFARELLKSDIDAHPDMIFLRRADDKKNISIEQVREMQGRLSLTSFLNSYKIALIEHAEDVSDQAAHALLKMLEEPHPNTVIIMIATDARQLLPTIVSRMQLIRCLPVPGKEIYDALVARGQHRSAAAELTAIACGRPGIALSFAADPGAYAHYCTRLVNICAALAGTFADTSMAAESLTVEGEADAALHTVMSAVRDALHVSLFGADAATHRCAQQELVRVASKSTASSLAQCLTLLDRARDLIAANVSPRVALEQALFHIY